MKWEGIWRPSVWIFYAVIVLEILYMISPFALYFYSGYGPVLRWVQHWTATAWLTSFFLPHFSETSSPILNWAHEAGNLLVLIGLALFAVGFLQVYTAKLLGRGAVTGGLYRLVRHPQYIGLAVTGLGVLLWWPRFLVLVMYVTMLFAYHFLARSEEQRCLVRFGDPFREYMARTGRFVPRPASWRWEWPHWLPEKGGARLLASILLYVIVVGISVAAGYALKSYSLRQIALLEEPRMVMISPALRPSSELSRAVEIALGADAVRSRLGASGNGGGLVAEVVPMEWKLPDLPLEAVPRGGHVTPRDYDRNRVKILFARAKLARHAEGRDIARYAYGLVPLVVVRVDLAQAKVLAIENPPTHVRWGDIPTPIF